MHENVVFCVFERLRTQVPQPERKPERSCVLQNAGQNAVRNAGPCVERSENAVERSENAVERSENAVF